MQRRTADGWRVEDLIDKAEISLACCDHPIPLDAMYHGIPADDVENPEYAKSNDAKYLAAGLRQTAFNNALSKCPPLHRSSQLLNEKRNGLDTHFGMPPFFLCGHAFELLLKAFLRAKGWPVTQLKRSHDVSKPYEQAVREGLQNKLDNDEEAQLDPFSQPGYQSSIPFPLHPDRWTDQAGIT